MEPKYIIAISTLGVFCILFLIFFVLLARKRKADAKLQAYLHNLYSDKNLIKPDYEFSSDEEGLTERRLPAVTGQGDEKSDEHEQLKIEEVFVKKEIEGIEEITGNYIPE